MRFHLPPNLGLDFGSKMAPDHLLWKKKSIQGRQLGHQGASWRLLDAPLGLLLAALGAPWGFWCLSGSPLDCRRGARALRDSKCCDFLWFYQAKVQFLKKNINFTCIRAMLGVCYAGKTPIFKKKHKFYLHNRHLWPALGACHAGKRDDWKQKTHFYMHIRYLTWLWCRQKWCFFLSLCRC